MNPNPLLTYRLMSTVGGWEAVPNWMDELPISANAERLWRRIARAPGEGITGPELLDRFGYTLRTLRRHLAELKSWGLLETGPSGYYVLGKPSLGDPAGGRWARERGRRERVPLLAPSSATSGTPPCTPPIRTHTETHRGVRTEFSTIGGVRPPRGATEPAPVRFTVQALMAAAEAQGLDLHGAPVRDPTAVSRTAPNTDRKVRT